MVMELNSTKTIAHGISEQANICMIMVQYLRFCYFRGQMIQKIAFVMGREYHMDPDPSYALTADNLIKILAIQMRFR